MRFLLYNIRYGTGSGMGFHFPFPFSGYFRPTSENLNRIIAFMRSVDPDIIGLVEVDSGSFRSGNFHQAESIAKALGGLHVYQCKYGIKSLALRVPVLNKQGNAFLTRNEIHAQRFHYFQDGIKRLIIELELKDVTILLVHLSLKFSHRHYQLMHLHSIIKEIEKPVIAAGDFNAFHGDREMRLFLSATGLKNANKRSEPTYPSWAPRRQLDFILHSPGITIDRFEVCPVRFSDHLPLVCDFTIESSP